MAWAVELKTGKVSYLPVSGVQEGEWLPFDANRFIVGVFVGTEGHK